MIIACGLLTFAHACGSWKRSRDLLPLFTFIAIVSYGVAMEIVSYESVDAFAHGPFTVMLYRGKLPLYVMSSVYPVPLTSRQSRRCAGSGSRAGQGAARGWPCDRAPRRSGSMCWGRTRGGGHGRARTRTSTRDGTESRSRATTGTSPSARASPCSRARPTAGSLHRARAPRSSPRGAASSASSRSSLGGALVRPVPSSSEGRRVGWRQPGAPRERLRRDRNLRPTWPQPARRQAPLLDRARLPRILRRGARGAQPGSLQWLLGPEKAVVILVATAASIALHAYVQYRGSPALTPTRSGTQSTSTTTCE